MKGKALGLYLGRKRQLIGPGVVKGLPRVGGILGGLEEFRGERERHQTLALFIPIRGPRVLSREPASRRWWVCAC